MNLRPALHRPHSGPRAILASAVRAATIVTAIAAGLGMGLGAERLAAADNIDLTTVPGRDSVQLTIYNSADLTLVREVRTLTFRKGLNPLQFSWAGTLIDPTSVDLRFRSHEKELDVLDTTFPHDRRESLEWVVESAFEGDAKVEITYFTSGISWAADYTCVASNDESRMAFDGFVRVANHSGENYDSAQVRLVVGQINLVETIVSLAHRGIIQDESQADGLLDRLGELTPGARGYRVHVEYEDPRDRLLAISGNAAVSKLAFLEAPPEIAKERLSEYFIYTVEGTQTIPNGWSKRLRLFDAAQIPFEIHHRLRPEQYGDALTRLYIFRNDEKNKLGFTPLPDGVIRVFRDNGHDGFSWLTSFATKYVPIGQEIEINLGPDPFVQHTRLDLRRWRDAFWFQGRNAQQLFSPTEGHRIQPDYALVGWNEHRAAVERLRNDGVKPAQIEIRVHLDGHVVVTTALDAKNHDYRTIELKTTLAPGQKLDLPYEVEQFLGINAKQNSVTLRRP